HSRHDALPICSFDLTCSQATAAHGFQSKLAEADFATAVSQTTVVAGHLLAELRTLGLQHDAYSLSLGSFTRSGRLRLQLFGAAANDLTLEDPNLDANHTVGGVRFVSGVVDVGAQGVQGHTTFAIPFGARDFRTTQTTAHLDLDALGTNTHGALHRALHGATEHYAALQLLSHALCNQ